MTFDNFNFKYSTFKSVLFLQSFSLRCLSHPTKVHHQITKTFACNGRSRTETQRIFNRLVFPVKSNVESEFIECKLCFLKLSLKMVFGTLSLFIQSVSSVHVSIRFPCVQTIDFVKSYAEGSILLLK